MSTNFDPKFLSNVNRGSVTTFNASANQQAATAASRLNMYSVYPGVVTAADINTKRLTVIVGDVVLYNCLMAASSLAALIGFEDVALPPVGANVLVVYCPDTSYVMGALPNVVEDGEVWQPPVTGDPNFDVLNQSDTLKTEIAKDNGVMAPGYKLPIDMLPGEKEITTGIGSAFRLFYNFAQMTAGDLAKVETHLMNDMVRIVDNYFVHHSVGGDDLIWSNGGCNFESHFTSYPFEAEGKEKEDDELVKKKEEGAFDVGEDLEPSASSHTGRWRKSTYIGWLGDMIHTWVTCPTEVASTYLEKSFRGGNFRQWIGSDGALLIQSAGGIQIEFNPSIIVPSILKAWNDPEFDAEKAMEDLDNSFLRLWGNGPDWKDLQVACWQMRAYLRYLPLWHSLARFRQMEAKGYCQIPKPSEAPASSPVADEEDKKDANPNAKPYGGYACITIDPSGSISMVSGAATSIIMNQGNIQISCPGNLELKAGGTVSVQGRNAVLQGADRVEITSLFGSLITKAATAIHALCEKGRIWLKSDAESGGGSSKAYPLDGEAPQPEMKDYGIILDATKSKSLVHGAKGAVLGSTEDEAPVYVETAGSDSDVCIGATKDIKIRAQQDLLLKGQKAGIAATATKITSQATKIGSNCRIYAGRVDVQGTLKATVVTSQAGFIGPYSQVGTEGDRDVDVSSSDADAVGNTADKLQSQDVSSKFRNDELNGSSWAFPNWGGYGAAVTDWNTYKASPWDDYAVSSPDAANVAISIQWPQTRLDSAPRTNTAQLPWPGNTASSYYFTDGSLPTIGAVPDELFAAKDIKTIKDMSPRSYTITYRKKS